MESREIKLKQDEIDLREILGILRKRLWLIVMVLIAAVMASGIITYFFLTPIYQASTQLLVNQSDKNTTGIYNLQDINTDLKLIETYSVIIKSPRIMELVREELGLNLSASELTGKVHVSPVKNSQVLSISVTDTDQHRAALIANGVAAVFQREIVELMNVDNVQILTEAKVQQQPVPIKPKPLLNLAIAGVLGLMGGVGIAFLLDFLDTSLRKERDIEQFLGIPVLGNIPIIPSGKKAKENMGKAAEPKAFPPTLEKVVGGKYYEQI